MDRNCLEIDKCTKSALIIQRGFRRYLIKKKVEEKNVEIDTESGVDCGGGGLSGEELQQFREKLSLSVGRQKHVDNLFVEIEQNIAALKGIERLGGNRKLSADVAESILAEATRRHNEQLGRTCLKWWQKL